jgi:hypothetical protein
VIETSNVELAKYKIDDEIKDLNTTCEEEEVMEDR